MREQETVACDVLLWKWYKKVPLILLGPQANNT